MLAGAIVLALSQVVLLLVAVRTPKGAAASGSESTAAQELQGTGPVRSELSPLATKLPDLGMRPSASAQTQADAQAQTADVRAKTATKPEDEELPRPPQGVRR
jgi:hypothetical protein